MSYSLDNIEYLDFCKLYGRVMSLKLRLQYEILKEYDPKGE